MWSIKQSTRYECVSLSSGVIIDNKKKETEENGDFLSLPKFSSLTSLDYLMHTKTAKAQKVSWVVPTNILPLKEESLIIGANSVLNRMTSLHNRESLEYRDKFYL